MLEKLTQLGQTDLIRKLHENKGRMISIVSRTDSRLLRKDKDGNPNPYGKDEVFSVCKQTVNPMANYENAVNRQLERMDLKPEYEAGPRKNGSVPVAGWPLAVHNGTGNIYLRVTNSQVVRAEYQDAEGNTIDPESVKPFVAKKNNRKQEDAGLEKAEQIKYRDIGLDNLVQVTIGGETFDMEDGKGRVLPWTNPWPAEQPVNA
jgi:hypothetical protein